VNVAHDNRLREVADRVLWLEDCRFKTLAGLVVDPVLRMQVEPTGPHADWEGRTLWFCSEGCRTEFTANPQRFVAGRPKITQPAGDHPDSGGDPESPVRAAFGVDHQV